MTKFYTYTNFMGEQFIARTNQDTTVSWIPADPANTDYQAYLAWVAEGNTAEQWTPETNA